MKIDLFTKTYLRFSHLDSPLMYFRDYISYQLKENAFNCGIEEIVVSLCYPPLFVLKEDKEDFEEWSKNEKLEKYPLCQIDQENKKISVWVKLPEIANFADKPHMPKKDELSDYIVYESKYKAATADVAKLILGKFKEAGEKIQSLHSKEFDAHTFSSIINKMEESLTTKTINDIEKEYKLKHETSFKNKYWI